MSQLDLKVNTVVNVALPQFRKKIVLLERQR